MTEPLHLTELTLTELHLYPIKSLGGLSVKQWDIDPRGLRLDRRWMLVRPDGRLHTQRESPTLRLLRVTIEADGLQVHAPDRPSLRVPFHPEGAARIVTVWSDETVGIVVSAACDRWFSDYLRCPVSLVFMPEDAERWQENLPYRSRLSFADGNPFHLVNESSVADLSRASGRILRPADLRPNLVVRGPQPYAEDYWRRIRIGSVEFDVVESCARCGVINIDDRARVTPEPLRTLARTRRIGDGLPFGQNMVQAAPPEQRTGTLSVGDPVEVLAVGDTPNPMY